MTLRDIDILNFKNIAEATLEFSPGLNCLLGRNGMGKSNLLEAVHFLCLARGMSSMPESMYIRHGEKLCGIKGHFASPAGSDELVAASIVSGKGKKLKRNDKTYTRISEHIGAFPLVASTPADSNIISGPGEGRRRLTDMVASQADPGYLQHLIRYGRALESRNRMLRAGVRDALLYESVESGMAEAAAALFASRKALFEELSPLVAHYYSAIAGEGETVSLSYLSALAERSLPEILAANRAKDSALGFTSAGSHRDDFSALLGDYPLRRLGSQGQTKTFAIALRFAIFRFLRDRGASAPILLLDDIFDKLDADRVGRIMEIVSDDKVFGQIFITDTNRKHLDDILSHIGGDTRLFEVEEGRFSRL